LHAATAEELQGARGQRVVRIVIPYPAGSSMDVMGRALAEPLAERWHRAVILDHRSGASGNVGAALVARSAPDGQALLLHSMAVVIGPHLQAPGRWSPLAHLRPVILLAHAPNVLVVPVESPHTSVADLVLFARANPGVLNFGSAGVGSSMHLCAELFMRETGTRLTHVPYGGSTPAMTDLIAGTLHLMFANLASALPHIRAGRVRAIGVTTSSRSPSAPDIPTLAEAGVANIAMSAWYGIMAPAATPDTIVEGLNEDLRWALAIPSVRHTFEEALGMQVVASTRSEFSAFLAQESARWSALVKSGRIRLE
jgi:tripartite-type tricarboxylate transporter receptor subunit TctC